MHTQVRNSGADWHLLRNKECTHGHTHQHSHPARHTPHTRSHRLAAADTHPAHTVSDMCTHVHSHHRGASTYMRIHDRDTHIQSQSQAVTFTLVPALSFGIPEKIVPEGP